jgi:hypothetical protein
MEVDLTDHAPTEPLQGPPSTAAGPHLPVVLDVSDLSHPDLGTIEALCRVALEARRNECRLRLRGACPELTELIELFGLARILRAGRVLRESGHPERPALDRSLRGGARRDQSAGVSQTG